MEKIIKLQHIKQAMLQVKQMFYYQINTTEMYPLTLERAAKMHFMHSKNISDTIKQVQEVRIMTNFQEVSTLLTMELKGTRYTFDSLQHCNWLCDVSVYLRSPPSSQFKLPSCGEHSHTTFILHKARIGSCGTSYMGRRCAICWNTHTYVLCMGARFSLEEVYMSG